MLLSAIAHFVVASPYFYQRYIINLKNKINYFRWYEYALSSSVMIVLIAILSGIYDFTLLVALFGLLMELHNQTTARTNWTAFVFGSITGLIPWVIIALFFFNASGKIEDRDRILADPILNWATVASWEELQPKLKK